MRSDVDEDRMTRSFRAPSFGERGRVVGGSDDAGRIVGVTTGARGGRGTRVVGRRVDGVEAVRRGEGDGTRGGGQVGNVVGGGDHVDWRWGADFA